MNVNKRISFIILCACLLFINKNSLVSAFEIGNDPNWSDDKVTDEYNVSLKYDSSGNLYYCTQPNLAWPKNCKPDPVTLNQKLSGAITYILNRYNEKQITYKAAQRMIEKILYEKYSTSQRDNYNLSGLTLEKDKNAQTYYNSAMARYNNNTSVFYYKQGTTTRITSLNFTVGNEVTISYGVTGPFFMRCSVTDGATVSINSTNKTITVNSNGKHLKEKIELSCSTYYEYRDIGYYECTNQDLVKPISTTKKISYGSNSTISSTPPSYTIKYNGNKGTTSSGNKLVTAETLHYEDDFTLRENMFVRPGYEFYGWRVYRTYDETWYYKGIGWRPIDFNDDNKNGHAGKKLYIPPGTITLDQHFIKNQAGEIDAASKTFYFYAQWRKVEDSDTPNIPDPPDTPEPESVTLAIKKINSSEKPIIDKDVSFEIYTGTGCNTKHTSSPFAFNTGGDGTGMIDLEPGTYSIKEIIAPQGYISTGECIEVGNIQPNEIKEIEVVNRNDCEGEFESNKTISNRLYLYKDRYPTYNNLLDFTITSATEACSATTYDLTSSDSCLTSIRKLESKDFTHNDLSAYNDTLFYNNKNHYCLTEFELNGSLQGYVKSGQFVSNSPTISEGVFTKTCYIHKDDIPSAPNNLTINEKLSEFIGKIELDDKLLNDNFSNPDTIIIYNNKGLNGEFYKYESKYNIEYYPWDVYAVIGSGEIRYDDCSNCKYLGKGIISKFSPSTSHVEIGFTIETPLKNVLSLGNNSFCSYDSVAEITASNRLQLEFRVIDTNTPFERDTNSNWCSEGDCDKDNSVVESVIKSPTANNSINKTKEGSLYTNQTGSKVIVLTPELIQQIRNYNELNPYDDYENLTKEETETGVKFKSKFLEQFNIVKTG